jgi:two-component system response regulator GlrR
METNLFLVLAAETAMPVADELRQMLERTGWGSVVVRPFEEGRVRTVDGSRASVCICIHPDADTLERSVQGLRETFPYARLLFVNLFDDPTRSSRLQSAGFDDFLPVPLVGVEVTSRVRKSLSEDHRPSTREADRLKKQLTVEIGLSVLKGHSVAFSRVLQEIQMLSQTDATVLITGETGTGKDLCARAIHYTSARARKPFLPVNCASIPEDLLENELFGHERGAYTDAREKYLGLIHEAEGGTLLLDDIESLTLKHQGKLLRFLESSQYTPLGSSRVVRTDIRIIAATNADLMQRARQGLFREDLYYRLAVLNLTIPPLRSRKEDIPELAEHFLTTYAAVYGKPLARLSERSLEKLKGHDWPGNVRELENLMHRTVVHSVAPVIHDVDITSASAGSISARQAPGGGGSFRQAKQELVSQFEREYVEALLRECAGNVSEAARRAGKNRRAFWEIMRKYGISRDLH